MKKKDKKIDMGHARALITIKDPKEQLALYEQIVKEGLSVRQVEELARAVAGETPEDGARNRAVSKNRLPEEYNLLRDHLSNFFQSKVQLVRNEQGKGRITIPFASDDELEKLIELFDRLR